MSGVDLNLLTSLDALLDEASVTRAARRLHVSQPSASHALGRLRELLGDPLLVRTSRGMQLTARAQELRPGVRAALAAAEAVLQPAPTFVPATARRTFVLTVPDQAGAQLLPALMPRLAARAPGVSLHVVPGSTDPAVALGDGDLELALGVFSGALPAGLREQPLWAESFTCAVRRGSPLARGPFDLARYLAAEHVFVAPRGRPGSFIDDWLAAHGHTRRIALMIPQFLVAPTVVATTDLVWTGPTTLVRTYAKALPLTLRAPPFAVPGFTVAMRWHVRQDRDPGLAWLRALVAESVPPHTIA